MTEINMDAMSDDELYGLAEEAQAELRERAEKLIGEVVLRREGSNVRAILVEDIDEKDDYLVVGGTTVDHPDATAPAGMAVWAPVMEVERAGGSTVERRSDASPTALDVLGGAAEEHARLDAARDWLCERNAGVEAIYAAMTTHNVHERVRDEYPANTPGQDGWSSFCEDWSAGTLAPARRSDALDAATGEGRR